MKLLNQKQLATALVVLGTVPFVVFTAAIAGIPSLASILPFPPAIMMHVFGVVIGSFVAGLHWGIHFCKRTSDSVYLYSSFIALLLWCSMWAAGSAIGLALVLLSFVLCWLEEYRLSVQRVTTAWFWKLRTAVTAIVVLCLAVSILFL
jgi:hypothetical protein